MTIKDDTAPVAVCKDITVQINDANGNMASIAGSDIDNGSNDNCSNVLTYSSSPNTFDCNNVGANTVTLTVNDNFGNTSTCTANVTVEDTELPIAICQDITIQLGWKWSGDLCGK